MSTAQSEPEGEPAPESRDESEAAPPGRNKALVKGVAFGIGSAAIVAALLFAGRNKGKSSD